MTSRRSASVLLTAVGVGILAVLAYANSLRNGFVWDDPIILDRQLVVFRSVWDVLVPPAGIPQFSPDYYRPVVVASYLLDRAIGGRQPFAYHCSVVLAHAGATVLLFVFALLLFRDRPGAMFGAATAAALFAVHPVHTESVAWMAGRSDVLATLFVLAALIVHHSTSLRSMAGRTRHAATTRGRRDRSGGRKRRGAEDAGRRSARRVVGGSMLTGLFLFLALGSKETALTLFPLLILLDWLAYRQSPAAAVRRRDLLLGYTGPVLAVLLYLVLRRLALGEFLGHAPGETGPARSPVDVLGAVAMYVAKLVAPLRLNAYIDSVPTDAGTLVGVVLLLVAATGLAIMLWRRQEPLPALLIAWLGVTLLPSLAVVWKIPEAPVAERYLYLPSAGYCLLLGFVAMRIHALPRGGWVPAVTQLVVGLLVTAGLLATMARNRVWHDNLSLWSRTAAQGHVSGMPLRSLAAELQKRGRLEEAQRQFEHALAKRNSRIGRQIIFNNLGTLAMRKGSYEQAERYYRRALEVESNAPDSLFNLGLAIFERGGRTREAALRALIMYRRAATLSPHDPDIEAALGQALLVAGEPEEAARHMRRALDLGVQRDTADSIRAYLRRVEASP